MCKVHKKLPETKIALSFCSGDFHFKKNKNAGAHYALAKNLSYPEQQFAD